MKLRIISVCFCFLSTINILGQDSIPASKTEKEYSFIIVDSPARLYTMRQFNENYLSTYRIGISALNTVVPKKTSAIIQAGLTGLLLMPLTHEEGHRSILTNEKIGSVSQPYFNKDLAAYVKGVRDQELIQLRDTKLPVYIRLHTAGLESDYALLLRSASLLNWKRETKDVLWTEYFIRKVSMVSYYAMGLFKVNAGIEEEKNELNRDIVGHDIYGAIRHLHRPDMEFYRYTNYEDLTSVEKKFVKRVGFRSLLNLLDPLLMGKTGFNFKGNNVNLNLGYGMVPFGDYIDQHFWISNNSFDTHFYLRQFENRNTWFPAFGAEAANISLLKNLQSDISLHGWIQPEDMAFNTSSGKAGGAVDVVLKYRFFKQNGQKINGLSANLGIVAKTKGFLLEEVNLDNHVGIRLGMSIWLQ